MGDREVGKQKETLGLSYEEGAAVNFMEKDYQDIASACWFFGTDLSKNITGSELIVDGGMNCQLYPQILNELIRAQQES